MVTRFMGGVTRFMGVYEIYGRVYEIYGSLRDLWELRDLWGVQQRPVDENTLPLEVFMIFVATCSRSVSHFRICGFHFSHLKWFLSGVG